MDQVHDNAREHRYEFTVDGQTAIAAYTDESGARVFTHTLVPPELEGHGVGTRLIEAALADVRALGLKVVPQCPFVAAYMERHPETRDLLAT